MTDPAITGKITWDDEPQGQARTSTLQRPAPNDSGITGNVTWNDATPEAPTKVPAPEGPSFTRSFGAGLRRTLPQDKQLFGGAGIALGQVIGSPRLTRAAVGLYERGTAESEPYQGPSLEDVVHGDASVRDWAGNTLGNLSGQVIQSGAASLVGALAGGAAGSAVPGAGTAAGGVVGSVAGLLGRKGALALAREQAEKYITQQAAKGVARETAEKGAQALLRRGALADARTLGAATAAAVPNIGQEIGSAIDNRIQGGTAAQDITRGQALGGIAAGTAAGLLDTATEAFNLSRYLGGASKNAKLMRRVGTEALAGALREGGTEAAQSVLVRLGGGASVADADAARDYIESAAAGALGGGVFSAPAGLRRPRPDTKTDTPPQADTGRAPPAAPPPTAPDAPAVITRGMARELMARGYDEPSIRAMAPAQAAEILRTPRAEPGPVPAASRINAPPPWVDADTGEVLRDPTDADIKLLFHQYLDDADAGSVPRSQTGATAALAARLGVSRDRLQALRKQVTQDRKAGMTTVDAEASLRATLDDMAAVTPPTPAPEPTLLDGSPVPDASNGPLSRTVAAGAAAGVIPTATPVNVDTMDASVEPVLMDTAPPPTSEPIADDITTETPPTSGVSALKPTETAPVMPAAEPLNADGMPDDWNDAGAPTPEPDADVVDAEPAVPARAATDEEVKARFQSMFDRASAGSGMQLTRATPELAAELGVPLDRLRKLRAEALEERKAAARPPATEETTEPTADTTAAATEIAGKATFDPTLKAGDRLESGAEVLGVHATKKAAEAQASGTSDVTVSSATTADGKRQWVVSRGAGQPVFQNWKRQSKNSWGTRTRDGRFDVSRVANTVTVTDHQTGLTARGARLGGEAWETAAGRLAQALIDGAQTGAATTAAANAAAKQDVTSPAPSKESTPGLPEGSPSPASASAPRIETIGSKGLLVHGDTDATRAALAAAGFKKRGRVQKGSLRFDAKDRAMIEKALGLVAEDQHVEGAAKVEKATLAVVGKSLQKAATNTTLDRVAAGKKLLADIDAAMADASDEVFTARGTDAKKTKEALLKFAQRVGHVTFDVPGDGTFKILNTKERLAEFRKKVASSPGFKKTMPPPRVAGRQMYELGQVKAASEDDAQRAHGALTDEELRAAEGAARTTLVARMREHKASQPFDGITGTARVVEAYQREMVRRGLLDATDVDKANAEVTEEPAENVEAAADTAATSPRNDLPAPTEAQVDAGNFKVGRLRINGLDVSIEHPAGVKRKPAHRIKLAHAYGYIRRTEGADGEHVDVYLGPKATDTSLPVFVVDQLKQDGGFDEHKVMMGFATADEAKAAYSANYPKGWKGFGAIRQMTHAEFKEWVQDTKATTAPAATRQEIGHADGQMDPGDLPSNAVVEDAAGNRYVVRYGRHWTVRGAPIGSDGKVGPINRDSLVSFYLRADDTTGGDNARPGPLYDTGLVYDLNTDTITPAPARETPATPETAPEAEETAPDSERDDTSDDRLTDFGEKIGGARKDTAAKSTKKPRARASKQGESWRNRYIPMQSKTSGRWELFDKLRKRFGNVTQVGRRAGYATEAEALADVPLVEVMRNHRTWDDSTTAGPNFAIIRMINDRKRVRLKDGFKTRDEAAQYLLDHAEEIIGMRTTFGEESLPVPEIATREGPARREGDATPQQFMDTFGFRGVEFGNWMRDAKGKNQSERRQVLNHAFDGLLDLAEILGVPPRALSLNGELALAFGARGQGLSSAKAHYESDYGVINLTKMRGAGSLAHEWLHALDHYLGRQDGKAAKQSKSAVKGAPIFAAKGAAADFASYGFRGKASGVREELREALANVIATMTAREITESRDTKKAQNWLEAARTDLQNALQSLRDHLAKGEPKTRFSRGHRAATVEELATFDAIVARWLAGNDLETSYRTIDAPRARRSVMRRTNDQLEVVSGIMKAVTGRAGFVADGGPLERIVGHIARYQQRLSDFEKAAAGEGKTRRAPTEFFREARSLDQGRGTDYWTTTHELLARAFSAYIEDRAAQRGITSEFLTYSPANAAILTPWGAARPFPFGEERTAINSAFDKLFETIESRDEGDGRVALFSMDEGASEEEARAAATMETKSPPSVLSRANPNGTGIRPQAGYGASVAEAIAATNGNPATPAAAATPEQLRRVNRIVTGATAKWGDNQPKVRVLHSADMLPAQAKQDPRYRYAKGFYDGETVYLVVPNLGLRGNLRRDVLKTLGHEAVGHYGIDRVIETYLGKGAWDKLSGDVARMRARVQDKVAANRAANRVDTHGLSAIERVVAEVERRYGVVTDARTFAAETLAVLSEHGIKNGWTARAIAAIRRFLRAILPNLTVSAADMHGMLRRSEAFIHAGESYSARVARMQAAMFDRAPSTETAAFRRWWRQSKVVDANGAPRVVHHGTADDFWAFDPSRLAGATGHMTAPLGFFFEQNRAKAQRYAENAAQGVPADERVLDVYLSIQNPATLTAAELANVDSYDAARALRAKLERAGHDGIQLTDVGQWIAFRPEQVKSIDNTGGFDPANADMRFAMGEQMRTRGVPEGAAIPASLWRNDRPLKRHADYAAAKAGDASAAVRLVADVASPLLSTAKAWGKDVIYVAPHAKEATGVNAIPRVLAAYLAQHTGGQDDANVVQTNRAYHTGADAMQRLLARSTFDGEVTPGGRYVLVDDVSTMGGTLADLADYIQSQGGVVVGSAVLVNASRAGTMAASPALRRQVERRFGDEIRNRFHLTPDALTADEARYLIGFRSVDELRNRSASAERARVERLRAKGVLKDAAESSPNLTTTPPTGGVSGSGSGNFSLPAESAARIDEALADPDGPALERAKGWLSGKWQDLKPFTLGFLQFRHLLELANDLPVLGGSNRLADEMQQMDADRNQLLSGSPDAADHPDDMLKQGAAPLAERWRKWAYRKGPAGWLGRMKPEAKALADLIHETTLDGMDPSAEYRRLTMTVTGNETVEWTAERVKERIKALREQMRGRPGDDKTEMIAEIKRLRGIAKAERAREAKWPGLVARWQALSPEAKEIYQNTRDWYSQYQDATEKALLERIDAMSVPETYRRSLKDRIRFQFESQRKEGVYFPLQRFGEYWVSVQNPDGSEGFMMFETADEWQRAEKKLKTRGFEILAHGRRDNTARAADAPSGTFVKDVIETLKKAHAPERVQDEIYQLFLSTLPEMSMRKRHIHRKGTPGFSGDALRVFAKSGFHGSYQLARLRHSQTIQTLVETMDKRLDNYRRGSEFGMSTTSPPEDVARADTLMAEIKKRVDWIMSPKDSQLANMATSVGFLYYLGASPASALVNLTQGAQVTLPVLAAEHGWNKAARVMAAATGTALRTGGNTLRALTDPDEKRALRVLEMRGDIDRTNAHTLAGMAEGNRLTTNPAWSKAMTAMSWMFHKAEVVNREAAGLAAYRLGRSAGKSFDEAVQYASDIINNTHFDYCVDTDTECLTLTGWKRFDQMTTADRVVSIDKNGRAVEGRVTAVNVFQGTRDVIEFGSTNRLSMVVTPHHRCVVQSYNSRDKKWQGVRLVEAQDLKASHHLLRAPLSQIEGRPEKYGEDFAALLGWIAAEGWYSAFRSCKDKHCVWLSQSVTHNPHYVDEIRALIKRLGGHAREYKPRANGVICWTFRKPIWSRVIEAMPDNRLTWDMVRDMPANEMRALVNTFAKGDGTRHGTSCVIGQATKNQQNLDVIQAMRALLGEPATMLKVDEARDRVCLNLHSDGARRNERRSHVRPLSRTPQVVDTVWCPTTEHGTWIARRHGAMFVTGNSSANRPRHMQSGTAKVLFQFKNYSVGMTWLMYRNLYQAFKGESPEVRRVARRTLTGILGMTSMMAGVVGLPIINAMALVANAAHAVGGDDDEPWDFMTEFRAWLQEHFGETAGDIIATGAVDQLGLSISSRVSLSDLWFRDADRELEGRDAYYNLLESIAGPMGGIGKNWFVGNQQIRDGHVWRGIETMMPTFAKNAMKGYRYATQGVNTLRGDPIVADVPLTGTIVQALGFRPTKVAEQQRINSALMNYQQSIQDRRTGLLNAFALAIHAKDDDARRRALEKIRAFNKTYPEIPIDTATIRRSLSSRAQHSRNAVNGMPLNRRLAGRLQEAVNPSAAGEK